jgi:serine/threonine protein kinase
MSIALTGLYARCLGSGGCALPSNASTANSRPGDPLFLDVPKYQIVEELGVGGFGVVFRGVHKLTSAHVAIKIDKNRLNTNVDGSYVNTGTNILHESKIMVHLLGARGVCQLRAYGIAFLQVGEIREKIRYIAMDLNFPILFKHNDYRWTLVLEELVYILEFIHNKRVLHNDLKRSNIMLATPYYVNQPFPEVRLIDFGLSKFLESEHFSEESIPPFKFQYIQTVEDDGTRLGEMKHWCQIAKECGVLSETDVLGDLCDKLIPKKPNYKAFLTMLKK